LFKPFLSIKAETLHGQTFFLLIIIIVIKLKSIEYGY